MIRGAYSHPQPFWDRGLALDNYGVNAVFIHSKGVDEATSERARSEGCGVFAEFATLNARYGLDRFPDAYPVDDSGNPAPQATWFMGVCPSHDGFREARLEALRDLLTRLELDGVWMDYLHWHAQFEDPYPVFIKTCFCTTCQARFQEWSGLEIQGSSVPDRARWLFMNAAREWENWRVSVIVDWARAIRQVALGIRPDVLIGAFHCAWKDPDLGGVRRRCLGLDFEALAPYVDVFSPMVYHGRSGKTPEYVRDYVSYFGNHHLQGADSRTPSRLWPIVQAHDEPPVSPEEFETVLRYGLGGKSSGVMMFTIASVAQSDGKLEVMQRVYREYAQA